MQLADVDGGPGSLVTESVGEARPALVAADLVGTDVAGDREQPTDDRGIAAVLRQVADGPDEHLLSEIVGFVDTRKVDAEPVDDGLGGLNESTEREIVTVAGGVHIRQQHVVVDGAAHKDQANLPVADENNGPCGTNPAAVVSGIT